MSSGDKGVEIAYGLGGDPALVKLARIVHAAAIAEEVSSHPFGAALRTPGGGTDVETDDQRLLERAMFVNDALYAWCARHAAAPTTEHATS